MSAAHREMIEQTLINLAYDMHTIGKEQEMKDELARLSDAELISVFNSFVESLE